MDFAFLQHTVAVMPPFARLAWAAVLLASLAVMILIQFLERRHFVRLSKAGSWASLRLLLLVIIPLTAGVLIIPAQAISGPEALAYFYGALFTLAPLTWFGMHFLCGRLLRPAFSKGESLFLAASALFTLFVPVIGLSLAQGPIFMASRSIEENAYQNAPGVALAHVAQAPRRFELPGAGTVFTQSLLAAPGIDLDRVNIRIGEHWAGDKNNLPQWLCRQGNDLHLIWPALEPTPQLRIFLAGCRRPTGPGRLFAGRRCTRCRAGRSVCHRLPRGWYRPASPHSPRPGFARLPAPGRQLFFQGAGHATAGRELRRQLPDARLPAGRMGAGRPDPESSLVLFPGQAAGLARRDRRSDAELAPAHFTSSWS